MSCKPCLTCCGALLLCASIALADSTQRIPTLSAPGDGAQPERVARATPRGGGECDVDNGEYDTSTIAPGTQWATDFFFAQVANNFTLSGDDENPCLVTEIVFPVSPYNPGCTTPANWTGVRVVIYNDNGENEPDGEPNDDGTISGGPPVADVQVSPDAFSFIALGGNDYEVTMNVHLLLEKNIMYWLAISPIMTFGGNGQVAWGSANPDVSYDGITALQHFTAAGLSGWQTPGGDNPVELDSAFTLSGVKSVDPSGACCSEGTCTEDVEVLACQSPFDRFVLDGTCDDVDPPCGGGACCFPDGSCIGTANAEECEAGGGGCEACEGDANGDGVIDPLDSGFVLARFGCSVGTGDPACDCADLNGDLVVDPLDSGFVLARFGLPCGPGEAGEFQGLGTTCLSAGCAQPPPDNDNCEDAITVVDGDTPFSTVGATTDGPVDGAAGPCADDFVGFNDVWFDYTVSCTGFLNVTMCEDCIHDTTLQVYDGSSCELGEQLGCGDDSCFDADGDLIGAGPSTVNMCSVVEGTQLRIRVGSWNDGTRDPVTGDAVLTITCSTENHDCCDPVGPAGCPGCIDKEIEGCVCGLDPFCCNVQWDEACVAFGEQFCDLVCE